LKRAEEKVSNKIKLIAIDKKLKNEKRLSEA